MPGADFDEDEREVYLVDNYLGGRILVFNMDTFEFKRGWGACGKALADIGTGEPPTYHSDAPPHDDFLGHVTIGLAGDLVYVADRLSNRIQVFEKDGEYLREFLVAPWTLDPGPRFYRRRRIFEGSRATLHLCVRHQ